MEVIKVGATTSTQAYRVSLSTCALAPIKAFSSTNVTHSPIVQFLIS